MSARPDAIVLLGPTGAGKSPLGDALAARGLAGRRCHHFDFGARLRGVAALPGPDKRFSAADLAFVREVLDQGRLLEDEHFPLAARILAAAFTEWGMGREPSLLSSFVILNGLPRHEGQARDLEPITRVVRALHLVATPDTIAARIRLNSGGDREGRDDDDLPALTRRLARFEARTRPLLAWYATRGVPVLDLPICVDTGPDALIDAITRAL